MLCLVAGGLMAWLLGGASHRMVLLLVAAILCYDLYHKQWSGSVIVMGSCRTFLYLVAASPLWHFGASAFPGWLLPFAIGIGCYIVGLTLIARFESKGSASSAAMQIARVLLFGPGIVAAAWMFRDGEWRMLIFIAVFAILVAVALRIMKKGGPAIGQAVGILLAGIAMVDALAVATVSIPLACGFVLMMPLLRLWQRKIAAT